MYLEEGFEQLNVKVILNSRNPTDDSVPYNLKFNMKEYVSCPTNMLSMVCLEGATILAPSMFGTQLWSLPMSFRGESLLWMFNM